MSFPEYGMMDITQERYVPRIFGFKVNPRSKSGPRMDWLRTFPKSLPNSQESAGDEEIQDKSQDQSMLEADVIDKEPTSNTTQPPATHSQDTTNPAQPDDDALPKQADGTPASPLSPTKDIMNGIEQTHLKS
ncbi:hypothetical protein IWQ62_005145 [Dispira parvispora]|uniref:Uncharacterized protein n=1 Tax=Dispira parvispora TaxID=1520584 RepID=A0A9W8ARJ3_9FUNG|nr:hypothetical protein IWQ62_005145 [Dispira parvispora]